MNRISTLFLGAIVLLANSAAHAGDLTDNPRYGVWATFKPGSSSTLAVDLDVQNNRVHLEVTKTLVSVAADQVVIETTTKTTVLGHEHAQPAVKETIPAKADKTEIKETGNREIRAMGKTFKCKVWDATGENPNNANQTGMGDTTNGVKAVIYVSGDVPGGVVELDGVGQNGKPMNFVLIEMKVK